MISYVLGLDVPSDIYKTVIVVATANIRTQLATLIMLTLMMMMPFLHQAALKFKYRSFSSWYCFLVILRKFATMWQNQTSRDIFAVRFVLTSTKGESGRKRNNLHHSAIVECWRPRSSLVNTHINIKHKVYMNKQTHGRPESDPEPMWAGWETSSTLKTSDIIQLHHISGKSIIEENNFGTFMLHKNLVF
ncbi:hypothetical protein FF38_04930 [Lucilia cuprina]|uniref:Uncharacterized protein n=1 Tax=Lucilia cuprina TaxID=7375 RepID=A0A0L0C012_LUCCU|nr:hypothetical protein FF38_04930 [Lucilia cuprina]